MVCVLDIDKDISGSDILISVLFWVTFVISTLISEDRAVCFCLDIEVWTTTHRILYRQITFTAEGHPVCLLLICVLERHVIFRLDANYI